MTQKLHRCLKMAALFLLLFAYTGTKTNAQWSYNPDINTPVTVGATALQYMQSQISDGAGGVFVVWSDSRNGTNNQIYAQHLNSSGTPSWGNSGVLLASTSNQQYYPILTSDGAGGIIVAWPETRSSVAGIYSQRVNSSGSLLWGSTGQLIVQSSTITYNASFLVSDGSGGAIVIMSSSASGTDYCYALYMNSSLSFPWGSTPKQIGSNPNSGIGGAIGVVSDGSGGIYVYHNAGSNGYPTLDYINSSGTTIFTTTVTTYTGGLTNVTSMPIASDGSGGAVVVFPSSNSQTLYAQHYNSSGVIQWASGGVTVSSASYSTCHLKFTYDGVSGYYVAWESLVSGTWQPFMQHLSSNGSVTMSSNGVQPFANPTSATYTSPQFIAGNSGNGILVWSDNNTSNSTPSGVYAQEFNTSGVAQWTKTGNGDGVYMIEGSSLTASSDASGGVVAIGQQNRNSIYYTILECERITSNGSLAGTVTTDAAPSAPAAFTYSTPNTYNLGTAITALSPSNAGYSSSNVGYGFGATMSVAIDASGNLYELEYNNIGNNNNVGTINKISTGGSVTTIGAIALGTKYGCITVDASGNIYVGSSTNVYKITNNGSGSYSAPVVYCSGFSSIQFNNGICADNSGNIYVTDLGNNTLVYKITNGVKSTIGGTGFHNPYGIAVDASGNVYVADLSNSAVKKIASDGVTVTTIASTNCYGLGLDASGDIFISTGSNVAKIASGTSTVTTILAGQNPCSIVADASGNVYYVPFNGTTITKLSPSTYGISPALPTGLSLNSNNGAISGTPTAAIAATTYTVTATNAGGSTTSTLSIKVNKGTPTITTAPTASGITYGQTLASSTLSGGAASVAGTFAFTTPSTAPNVGTASQGYTFTPTDNSDYNTVTGTVNVTVTAAVPTITGFSVASKTYGASPFTLTAPTSNSAGAFSYTSSNTAVATISGSTVTVIGVGTSTITATQAANGNYTSGSTTATFTVNGITPTITVTVGSYTYTGSAQGPTVVTGNTGNGAVTWSYVGTGATSYGPSSTLPTHAGSYTATGTVAANGNYAQASSSATAFTIGQATPTPTLSITNATITYTGSAVTANVTVSSGTAGTASNILYNGSSTVPTTAGSYTVTANYTPTDATDYTGLTAKAAGTFTISKATPTPTFTITNATINYTGSSVAAVVTVSGGTAGTTSSTLYNGSSTVPTAAGSYPVTVNFTPTDATDYTGLTATAAGTFTINTVAPTIGSFTVAAQTYGSSPFSLTAPSSNSAGAFSYTSSNTAVATISGSTVTLVGVGSTTITATQAANGNYTSGSTTATLVVNPEAIPSYTWKGTTSTNYGTASNWANGLLPTSIAIVTIPSSAANQPVLSAATTVGGIVLNGTLALNGQTLTINGAISGSGNFSGSTSSSLVISGTGGTINFLPSSNKLDNLTISGGTTVTLGDTLKLYGLLTPNSGTLNSGGNLVLVSNSAGTAVVGPVGGAINGIVTVQRHFPNDYLGYRDIGISVYSAGPLGTLGTAWGDSLATGYSVYDYIGGHWSSSLPSNTSLLPLVGYRTLVAPNTTLNYSGKLITGTQTPTLNGGQDAYSFVANPYASQVDFGQLSSSGLYDGYWYFDPTYVDGTNFDYVHYSVTTGSSNVFSPTSININQYLQPGQAIFLQSNSTGTPTISFTESAKNNSNAQTSVFGINAPLNRIAAGLFTNGNNVDGAVAVFNSSFCDCLGSEDALKIANNGENLTFVVEGKDLCANGWGTPQATDEMPIHLYNLKTNTAYTLQFQANQFVGNGLLAYLKDDVLGTQTLLAGDSNIVVSFATTADTAAYSHRYSIVFGTGTLPVKSINLTATELSNKQVSVKWSVIGQSNISSYKVERSADGKSFTDLETVPAPTATSYSYIDATATAATNYYRIKATDNAGAVAYSNVARVSTVYGQPLTVWPNPIISNSFKISLGNAGKYTVSLVDNLGRTVYTTTVSHSAASTLETVTLANKLATGGYTVKATDENGKVSTTQVIIK